MKSTEKLNSKALGYNGAVPEMWWASWLLSQFCYSVTLWPFFHTRDSKNRLMAVIEIAISVQQAVLRNK